MEREREREQKKNEVKRVIDSELGDKQREREKDSKFRVEVKSI